MKQRYLRLIAVDGRLVGAPPPAAHIVETVRLLHKQGVLIPMGAEHWLPVVGFEGEYEVSDHGRVRSLDRVVVRGNGRPCARKGMLIGSVWAKRRPSGTTVRYRVVRLHRSTRYIGVLVLEAFIGPRPHRSAQARHLNDNSLDDRLENLAWGTQLENFADAIRNDRLRPRRGQQNGRAVLTENDVYAIRAAHAAGGVTLTALSSQYGVSRTVISDVVHRKSWRHIS